METKFNLKKTQAGDKTGKMLGVEGEEMYAAFVKPRIKVGTEFVTKGQNVNQCNYSVGAMAKAIFDRVFKFLVKKCNQTLDTQNKKQHFIGVLDIAGFEIFDVIFFFKKMATKMATKNGDLLIFYSTTVSSNCASTLRTRNSNNSSTITCLSWNRKSTRGKDSTGFSRTLGWICKLVST